MCLTMASVGRVTFPICDKTDQLKNVCLCQNYLEVEGQWKPRPAEIRTNILEDRRADHEFIRKLFRSSQIMVFRLQ